MSEYENISRARNKEKLKSLIETLDRNAALAVKGESYQKVGIRFVALMQCRYDESGDDIIDETELFCNEGVDGETCDFIDGNVFKELLAQYLTHFTGVINTERKYRRYPKYIFSFGIKMVEGDFNEEKDIDHDLIRSGYDLILRFNFEQIEDMMEVIKSNNNKDEA